MSKRKATLIYLENEVLLSKKIYHGWKECQNDYEHYKTNMAPMNIEEVLNFFTEDWGEDDIKWPFTKKNIVDFYQSDDHLLSSRLRKKEQ